MSDEQLADVLEPRPVTASETVFEGRIWDVVRDTVDLGSGTVVREVVRHPGAVAVVALDEQGRVLMIRQYRHPVGAVLWELPAGLMDVEGEPPHVGAARELAEEADLRADRWDLLLEHYNSPGGMDEALRIFLARDVSPVPEAERHEREDEEADIELRWVPLDEVVEAGLAGRLHNGTALLGVLAARAARESGWTTLRPVDEPWPFHPRLR